MSAKKLNKASRDLFILVFLVFTLLLTSINISGFSKKIKVLGASVEEAVDLNGPASEELFWEDFLSKHPSYIPGWIETGRFDKAMEIDPNYIIP